MGEELGGTVSAAARCYDCQAAGKTRRLVDGDLMGTIEIPLCARCAHRRREAVRRARAAKRAS